MVNAIVNTCTFLFFLTFLRCIHIYTYVCVCVFLNHWRNLLLFCVLSKKKKTKKVGLVYKQGFWSRSQEAKKKKTKKNKKNQSNRIDNYIPCFFPMTNCYISVSSRNLGMLLLLNTIWSFFYLWYVYKKCHGLKCICLFLSSFTSLGNFLD